MFIRTEEGTKCLNLDSIPIALIILVATVTICFLQERFSSIKTPRYFMQSLRPDLHFYRLPYHKQKFERDYGLFLIGPKNDLLFIQNISPFLIG